MKLRWIVAAALAAAPVVVLAQAAPPKAFTPGDIFIDGNGDTLQITKCKGSGWQMECQVRRLAESGKAPIDPSDRWWSVDTLRGSESNWIYNGGARYSGPKVPLPGAAAAPGAAPVTAPGRPPVRTPVTRPAPAAPIPPTTTAGRQCPNTPNGRTISGATPASTALFRQKVTDSITMGSNTARGWYGVILENFTVGTPIINRVGQTAEGVNRINNAAPVGARLYPVSTTMTVCEGWQGGSGSWRTSAKKYHCFVSKDNEWICGATN